MSKPKRLPHAPATLGGVGALPFLNQAIAGSRLGVGATRVPGRLAVAAARKSAPKRPASRPFTPTPAHPLAPLAQQGVDLATGKAKPPAFRTNVHGTLGGLASKVGHFVVDPAVHGAKNLPHDVASGNVLGTGLDVLGVASVIPPLRGARALGEAAGAYRAAEEGARARAAASAAGESYRAGKGVVVPALAAGARKTRALKFNELTQQLPRSRSVVARTVAKGADVASVKLQPHLHDVPGARIVTAGERVAKAAGREQRVEGSRAVAGDGRASEGAGQAEARERRGHRASGLPLLAGTQSAVFSRGGVLAVTVGAGRYPCPSSGTITSVVAAVGTAPQGPRSSVT